ncbi:MAG: TonB-dependent receptor [Steroidobacteraceae bacterium]|nr:TonB-dependent receptor [Steroidobacteraceae bacterium]MDW8258062.1 TonB-dependent receptor [Gammaproteobacteria bacterium]
MGLLIVSALAMPALQAQEESDVVLEEVIVTAQKREESLRDVPISVNAVSGAKLAEAGIVRLDDLKAYVPNLQVTETGIANNFYMRGIGSGLNQGFEQSVSIYADGIYRGRGHQSRLPFLDLERVEALRGPQPILFGKNAIAGAVNLISARPTDEFEGSLRIGVESEIDGKLGELVLSGPLGETFGARLALRWRETEGYAENLTLARDEPSREEAGGRLMLTWRPSEVFDATLRFEGGSFDVVGRQVEIFGELPAAPVLLPNGMQSAPPVPGLRYSQILRNVFNQNPGVLNNEVDFRRSSNGDFSNLDNEEVALTLNWKLGSVTLTSVSGYSAYDLDELCDCDFTGGLVFNAGITEDFEQLSQELRLVSDVDQRISWIAGLFYQKYDLEERDYVYVMPNSIVVPLLNGNPMLPPGSGTAFANTANPRLFTQESDLYAVFAQATWNVTDRFRITAGGRYSQEDKKGLRATQLTAGVGGAPLPVGLIDVLYNAVFGIVRHTVSGKRDEDNFSPLLNVQYDFGDDSMVYASFARGFKSGGYDARSNRPVVPPAPLPPPVGQLPGGGTFEYAAEEADAFEIGVKTGIGRSAEINAAVFYTDYTDLQTSAFDGRLGFNVGNGSAEVRGAELEARWRATERLYFAGSIAYLDFEWTRYDGQCYFNPSASILSTRTPGNCNYDGFTNQLAPEMTAVVSADYRWPIGNRFELRTSLDATYSDSYITSLTLDPASVQDSYTKLNARISFGAADGKWAVALIGRNLTDEEVVSYSGEAPLSGSIFSARSYYGFVDPPRTVALEATVRF